MLGRNVVWPRRPACLTVPSVGFAPSRGKYHVDGRKSLTSLLRVAQAALFKHETLRYRRIRIVNKA